VIGMTFTPLGRALARRLAGGAPDPELEREVHALRDEVAELREESQAVRRELAEAHERLDFAERMIAQARTKGALPAGET
jgi:chromosome segregation ATPase